jgi:hypothetical protein
VNIYQHAYIVFFTIFIPLILQFIRPSPASMFVVPQVFARWVLAFFCLGYAAAGLYWVYIYLGGLN